MDQNPDTPFAAQPPENPYAAPRARTDFVPGGTGILGEPQRWEIGEVLGGAWSAFEANWGVLLGTLLLSGIAIYVVVFAVGFAAAFVFHGQFAEFGSPGMEPRLGLGFFGVQLTTTVVTYLIEAYIAVGYWRLAIAAARGERPTLATFFSGGGRYLTMLLLMIVQGLGTFVGFIFFIVPGIILALGWLVSPALVADTELSAIGSLKTSWAISRGHKMNLFLFGLVLMLLNVAGALPCGLGLLVTAPMSAVALAIVYTRMSGRTTQSSAAGTTA